MSKELTTQIQLNHAKNGEVVSTGPTPLRFQIDTPIGYPIYKTFTVGTADMTLDLDEISAPGICFFQNLDPDPAKSVLIGSNGTSYPIEASPNEPCGPFRFNGSAIHAKSTSGNVVLAAFIGPSVSG